MHDGTLVVASSGLRTEHVCPYGKTVLNTSHDNGQTWSAARVIQDSMIDDRDAGVVDLGGGKMLVSWFRSDTRIYVKKEWPAGAEREIWDRLFATWTDEKANALVGSWVMLSADAGATWGEAIRAPVTAPHGPIMLKSGNLLYLGKNFKTWESLSASLITTAPVAPHFRYANFDLRLPRTAFWATGGLQS